MRFVLDSLGIHIYEYLNEVSLLRQYLMNSQPLNIDFLVYLNAIPIDLINKENL